MTIDRMFIIDAVERAVATYLQVFLGLLIVSGVTDISTVKVAAVSAIPAGLSVLKSVLAERFAPGTVSPASLAPR